MTQQMDPGERVLILALMECADELRTLSNFPRGLGLAESMRMGDSVTPVLVELIEAWCMKRARDLAPDHAKEFPQDTLPDTQSFEQMRAAIAPDEKICLKLVPSRLPQCR